MSKFLPDIAGLFCLIVFVVFITIIGDSIFSDGDPFWHITAGLSIIENKALINYDIFSHSAYGTPWIAHEWLAEIIMAIIYQLAGLEGLTVFFVTLTSLTFWLLYKITVRKSSDWAALTVLLMALFISGTHMAGRPHMFSWFFLVVTLSILTEHPNKIVWLPLIMVLWANLHGGFVLGILLQAIFILGTSIDERVSQQSSFRDIIKNKSRPLVILFLSLFAVCLNPFGYELLLFPFHVSTGIFAEFIGEWQSPNLQELWYFRYLLVFLFLMISLPRVQLSWTERFLMVFFLNAALTHNRHISLFLIALAPFLARNLYVLFSSLHVFKPKPLGAPKKTLSLSKKSGPVATLLFASVLLIAGSLHKESLSFLTPQKIMDIDVKNLNALVSFLESDLPEGNMFNEYSLGGYLLYALNPPPKVYIDGRADMYGEELLEHYRDIIYSSDKRGELLDLYKISWVVYPKDSDLMKDLMEKKTWKVVYDHEPYMIISRSIPEQI